MRRYRIGRAETNDIVLPEATVSREHADLVELGGGRFEIKDLGSTYGLSVRQGQDWAKVTETELRHDTQFRLGEYQTTVADLLRETDKTVVRAKASAPAAAPQPIAPPRPPAQPAAPSKTAPPAPPKPAAPKPPRTASPTESGTTPPLPPAPNVSPFAFLGDLPPEKRTLVWLAAGFAGFLLISLITLILALVL